MLDLISYIVIMFQNTIRHAVSTSNGHSHVDCTWGRSILVCDVLVLL